MEDRCTTVQSQGRESQGVRGEPDDGGSIGPARAATGLLAPPVDALDVVVYNTICHLFNHSRKEAHRPWIHGIHKLSNGPSGHGDSVTAHPR